jgi:hypothetical protein
MILVVPVVPTKKSIEGLEAFLMIEGLLIYQA